LYEHDPVQLQSPAETAESAVHAPCVVLAAQVPATPQPELFQVQP
jgi:hypothetical protein